MRLTGPRPHPARYPAGMSPRRRRGAPLPPRGGLTASRVRCPAEGVTAGELIAAAVAGQRRRHPADDAAAIAARFAAGEVVDAAGRPVAPEEILPAGADLWFRRMPAPERTIAGPMPIVHADTRVVVVDKPPFLATTPRGAHITETAVVRLRRALGEEEPTPAHRLDRLTSGLLLFIRQPADRGAYQELFATPGAVTKIYEARTRAPGRPIPAGTELATRQEKIRGVLRARTIPGEPNARTIVESVRELGDGTAVWRLRPLTGRTHQLRLHLAEAGCPILGDPLYPEIAPAADEDPARPLHLLCRTLAFADPRTGERREFHSRRDLHSPAAPVPY